MRRRDVTMAPLLLLAAAPSGLMAQQPAGKVWRIGYLWPFGRANLDDPNHPFLLKLRDLGYVEGRHYTIEGRWADGRLERLPELAAELVQSKVDLILANGDSATLAAQRATATTPIVGVYLSDPIGRGIALSLAQPGGNTTGFANAMASGKLTEIIVAVAPKRPRVALLVPEFGDLAQAQHLAQGLGASLLPVKASSVAEIDKAFDRMADLRAGAVIVVETPFFTRQLRQIADLAAQHRLPSISSDPWFAPNGGLLSYGHDQAQAWSSMSIYVDRIFKGTKAGSLPIEQPTKFELRINLKAANAIGVVIPASLMVRADQVIKDESSPDWVDVKDPQELRALYSNKTLRGTLPDGTRYATYYRSDGRGVMVIGSKRIPRTWEVKGQDQVCVTTQAGTDCYRVQRNKTRTGEHILRHVIAEWNIPFTVEDGIPSF